MANKTITMSVSQGSSQIDMTCTLSDECTWMAQAYLFHKFLLAQGYHLDGDAVGSDVGSYVTSEVEEF
jgi:hypothetical protein